jgi:hypothetical protein
MAEPKKSVVWLARILSALPMLLMTFSGVMKLSHRPEVVEGFVGKYGYPEGSLLFIGIVELLCVVLYAIPRTAILGGILMAAYLGGAVATHVRAGEAFIMPIVLGIVAWGGLFFRDTRLHALIPLRKLS